MGAQDCGSVISLLGETSNVLIDKQCAMLLESFKGGFYGEGNIVKFTVPSGINYLADEWISQNKVTITKGNPTAPNARTHIYITPKPPTHQGYIDIMNNPMFDIQTKYHRTFEDASFYVHTLEGLQMNFKPVAIYIREKILDKILHPEQQLSPISIVVQGESGKDECTNGKSTVKGFEFIAQKGTYIEIALDFIDDSLAIDTVTGLPDGLLFTKGKIRGTPTLSGEYMFGINISDGSTIECKIVVPQLIRLL